MSAENAWRIARETVSEQAYLVGTPYAGYVASLPMPPAFRAEVEAEAEELRKALTRIATPEAFFVATSDIDPEALGRMIYAQAVLDGASLKEATVKAEAECRRLALLSRLGAKEEVSLRPLPDAAFEPRPAGWGEGGKDE